MVLTGRAFGRGGGTLGVLLTDHKLTAVSSDRGADHVMLFEYFGEDPASTSLRNALFVSAIAIVLGMLTGYATIFATSPTTVEDIEQKLRKGIQRQHGKPSPIAPSRKPEYVALVATLAYLTVALLIVRRLTPPDEQPPVRGVAVLMLAYGLGFLLPWRTRRASQVDKGDDDEKSTSGAPDTVLVQSDSALFPVMRTRDLSPRHNAAVAYLWSVLCGVAAFASYCIVEAVPVGSV